MIIVRNEETVMEKALVDYILAQHAEADAQRRVAARVLSRVGRV